MDEGGPHVDRSIRVLHAEDDASFRDLVADLLETDGEIDVVSAATPATALDRLAAERFDCVLCDYDADESGTFLPVIEATENGPPCVLLTGKDREQVATTASAAVDDYLRKGASEGMGKLAERVRTHAERYRSTERYRALFETGAGPMVIHDAETGRVIDANPQFARLLGYAGERAPDIDMSDIVPGDEPYTSDRATSLLSAAAGGDTRTFEWEHVTADGGRVPVEVTLQRMDVAGAGRVLATVREISDRRRREAALERHKGHLERLHDAAAELLGAESREDVYEGVLDAATSVLSPEYCVLLVRDERSLTPVVVGGSEIDPTDEPPVPTAPGWEAVEAGETRTSQTEAGAMLCVPVAGHGVLCLRGCEPAADHARELAETLVSHAAVALDRADREAQLQERSRRRDSLAAAFPDHVFFLDADGVYREVWHVDTQAPHGGSSETELLGESVAEQLPTAAATRITAAVDEALATGEIQELSYHVEETSWFEARVAPLVVDGEPEVVLVARDVTTQREYEQRLEAQNERLDEFASMVSHDLRNPLTVVQGRLDLIESVTDDGSVAEHAGAAQRAAGRMNDLIEDMLTVARTDERSLAVGPVALVSVATRAWSAVAGSAASLAVDVDDDVRIEADENQLIRLFENLFRNAVEHGSTSDGPEAGDVVERGSTGNSPEAGDVVERGSTTNRPEAGDGGSHAGSDVSVTVERTEDGFAVADDGPGIPEVHRDRVFESGYSTATEGSGYGLDIVDRVAEAHGWSVSLAEKGEGARFVVRDVEFVDDSWTERGGETAAGGR